MNNIIKTRRSIRRYEAQEIPQEKLDTILEAVQWTPSWANTQCWEVVIVKDGGVKTKLQECIAPKNPATKAITAAPVVLVLCAKLGVSGYYNDMVTTKFGEWYMFDLGMAAQSICLSAHNLGLGTVVVGLFDHQRAATILKVPQGHELVCLIPLGYPAKEPKAPERRSIDAFIHQDCF